MYSDRRTLGKSEQASLRAIQALHGGGRNTYLAEVAVKHPKALGDLERPARAPARILHMSNSPEPGPESTADREFVHSRLIDAPRERVFRALAEPGSLSKWWGPDGFTSTFHTFEFRPGGQWRFILHGPDGTDYPNENVFREIVSPQRVVIEHLSDDHHFLLTITLADQGGQTLIGWRQVFDTAAHRNEIAPIVSQANEQVLSRLAAEVLHVG
jgi:uncharacterized protein YndB with AHSA1/START domain